MARTKEADSSKPAVKEDKPVTRSEFEKQRNQREIANADSPLLELPAELRNHIHELLLPSDEVTKGSSLRNSTLETDKARNMTVLKKPARPYGAFEWRKIRPLFAVCRTLHQEACSIYYGSNVFHLNISTHSSNSLLSKREEFFKYARTVILTEENPSMHLLPTHWLISLRNLDVKFVMSEKDLLSPKFSQAQIQVLVGSEAETLEDAVNSPEFQRLGKDWASSGVTLANMMALQKWFCIKA